jgi:L-alanine-DL-glutamate epimerase-like enolase superfamily enzyme
MEFDPSCFLFHLFAMPSSDFDVRILSSDLNFVPVETRMPLKFGNEVLTSVSCARVSLHVRNGDGKESVGWGETPLSVQWVWPSEVPYGERLDALLDFCAKLSAEWSDNGSSGHALELGHSLLFERLPQVLESYNREERAGLEPIPWLAALVCASPYDLALHDAYGIANNLPTYQCYGEEHCNVDLSAFLEPSEDADVDFSGKHAADFLVLPRPEKIPVWHLVGGLDPLDESELKGDEPRDCYPVHLEEWIESDGLNCLKIKLRGNDSNWDYERLSSIGRIAESKSVEYLTTDFNCTVTDPAYVNEILDRLEKEAPETHRKILYVEQPFPYDLEAHRIDVHSVAERKPLFMDESAHDWEHVRLGRSLGWTGVALKTCKTQTGALLSLCWAKAHGMDLMVQDLTNPMLAQVPHVLLAAHAGTIMGVESNGMQFYPEASSLEARVHPGIYRRRGGELDLSTLIGPGFGYQMERIQAESAG